MMYPHPIIAKEGWPYLALLGVVTLLTHYLGGIAWSWPLWIIFFFVLQFFRDPQRIAALGRDLVLSPADGRIVVVEKTNDPYAGLVQVAGLIARRILCYIHVGDRLKAGERYGFIRFGSRVDVYLPLTAEPLVSVGDKVFATNTALARLPDLD